MMTTGALVVLAMVFKWMGSVISENQNGLYKNGKINLSE